MAFAIRNLSVLAYANGFTLWHYRAETDPLATIGSRGFFDGATEVVSRGDMLMVSAADGARVLTVDSVDTPVVTARIC